MGIHSWLVDFITPKGYNPYAAFYNYESFVYVIYGLIVLCLFALWLIWDSYRNETPEEKAQRKLQNKEERWQDILIVLIILSIIISGWSMGPSCFTNQSGIATYCFPIFLIGAGLASLFAIIYFIYKVLKRRNAKIKEEFIKKEEEWEFIEGENV